MRQVLTMSPVAPRFPITSLFIVRPGPLTDAVLRRAWTPKDSTDQTSVQDALLELLHQTDSAGARGADGGRFVYRGQCGHVSSTQDRCWTDALDGQFVSTKPLPGLYLTGSWCDQDEVSNLTLTCPCIPEGGGDWCIPSGQTLRSGPCGVQRCAASETLFVHFGTWQMSQRAHEILKANAWSCAADGA
jgi:hypothetical protein